MTRQIIGRYFIADSKICHGKLTFTGTRIMVADVLDMVAMGMDWKEIVRQWHNSITEEAITEAITLSTQAFIDHAQEYAIETIPA